MQDYCIIMKVSISFKHILLFLNDVNIRCTEVGGKSLCFLFFPQTFLWVSHLKGLPKGVLWPAKLVESKSKNESICVYIKCDNAE